MIRTHCRQRSGQSLVEFATVALVLYLLLAAIVTFGHALYAAQALQGAVDLAAHEISRTPLPADDTFESVLDSGILGPRVHDDGAYDAGIYDADFLVFDLDTLGSRNFFADVVPTWPRLNQQLATLMIVDRPDWDGDGVPDANLIRYPGAILQDASTPTGYTVGIPLVESRTATGVETIRWVPVVEEIDTEETPADDSGDNPDPFRISSSAGGIVALRINYPFQSAAMSSHRANAAAPLEPTIRHPNAAVDAEVSERNADERPGDLLEQPLVSGNVYAGTYGGTYGLGARSAMGQVVRPYRRIISAQAVYRREVFSN